MRGYRRTARALRQLRAPVAGKVFRELASDAKSERTQPPRSLWRATAIGRALYVKSAITSLDERQSPAPMKEWHR
jgi:hypothetical protein